MHVQGSIFVQGKPAWLFSINTWVASRHHFAVLVPSQLRAVTLTSLFWRKVLQSSSEGLGAQAGTVEAEPAIPAQ